MAARERVYVKISDEIIAQACTPNVSMHAQRVWRAGLLAGCVIQKSCSASLLNTSFKTVTTIIETPCEVPYSLRQAIQ